MTHWDGLASATKDGTPQRICILGATNRVQDIDDAILRRMPKKFPVPLPAAGQRRRILSLILRDTTLDPADFDLEHVVRLTAGMSGSDLKDVCRDAAMIPVRDLIRSKKLRGEPITARIAADVRPIRTADFFAKAGLSAVSEARMKASGSKPAVAAHPTGEVDSDEYVTDDDDDRPAASAIAENHR